jgi:predicted dehydrogenase
VKLIKKEKIGKVLSITSQTRESWNGILKAHPWLSGPEDTYLASIDKGGGALFEHSHALNLLLYFIDVCNLDRVKYVTAALDIVSTEKVKYDRYSFLTMFNDSGNIFHVIQDVVTNPPVKELRINGTLGDLIWRTSTTLDEVVVFDINGEIVEEHKIKKNRRDDFYPEIMHIKFLLESKSEVNSPLDLKYAIDTNKIIVSSFESHKSGKKQTLTI